MTEFNLFDLVQLLEPVALTGFASNAIDPLEAAPVGTAGNIVEILEPGEAFLVELYGDWVVSESVKGLRRAKAEEEGAFRETIGVETVYPQQIELISRSNIIRMSLYELIDELPDSLLQEVREFAESLKDKVST